MSPTPPYPPHGWPSSPPPSPWNGHDLGIGMALGEIRTEGRRQTEILLGIHDLMHDLPDKIAARLPQAPPPPAGGPTRMQQIADLLRALVPLALLAAIVAGKLTLIEALPLIRQSMGLQ